MPAGVGSPSHGVLWLRLAGAGVRSVSLLEEDGGRLFGDLVHLGHDPGQAASVGDPCLVETCLLLSQVAGDGLALDRARPLPVGAMELRRVGAAAAVGLATAHEAADEAAGADEAGGGGQLGGQLMDAGLGGLEAASLRAGHG